VLKKYKNTVNIAEILVPLPYQSGDAKLHIFHLDLYFGLQLDGQIHQNAPEQETSSASQESPPVR
jgi:hypothetical protein